MNNLRSEILNLKWFALAACLVAGSAFAGLESEPAYKMTEAQLLALVQGPDENDRVTACQELMHRGGAASVPVLAALLTEKSTEAEFHAALYGLQNIPDASVDAALAAAEKVLAGARRQTVAYVRRVRANATPDGYAGATAALTAFPPKTPVQQGDLAAFAALVKSALGTGGDAALAKRQLVAFPNAAADRRLLELVQANADVKEVRLATDVLGERRARAVLGPLAALAVQTADKRQRTEIFKAFASLCDAQQDLPLLLELLAKFPDEERLAGAIIRVVSRAFDFDVKTVKVLDAKFGNFEQNRVADVKLMVEALVDAGSREIMAGCRLVGRGGFPGDPAPGQPKELRIAYSLDDGLVRMASVPENEMLTFSETVLPDGLAQTLVAAWTKAAGAHRAALKRILAALARRGTVPGADAVLFRPLIGTDLADWKQDGTFFEVRNGVLTAESTPAKPCTQSRYLIYAKEQFTDFELRGQFRLSASANSGIQLRSTDELLVDSGYQADMDGAGRYVGYIFHTRQHLVGERGADVALAADGRKKVAPFADGAALQKLYRPDAWNDIRVVVKDRALAVWINGVRTSAVIDAREDYLPKQGYISLQMHQGAPMKIEFRDLRVRTDEVVFDANLETALAKQLADLERGEAPTFDGAEWIWHPKGQFDGAQVMFTAELDLPAGEIEKGALIFSCDDSAVFAVNGQEVASQTNGKLWYTPTAAFGGRLNLKAGRNRLEVAASNNGDVAGFLAMIEVAYRDGRILRFPTSARGWQASLGGKPAEKPQVIGPYGCPPYGKFK